MELESPSEFERCTLIRPTFSVVLPAFNAARTIDRALQSIFDQSVHVEEVIVIDDGSSDRSGELIREWSNRLPIVLIRNAVNQGIAQSLRIGVEASSSDWILRLDADDRWMPRHVECMRELVIGGEFSIISAPAIFVDEAGRAVRTPPAVTSSTIKRRLLWDNPLVHSATGFSRQAYETAGGYSLSVRWQDYDLWIRLLRVGNIGIAPEVTVEYTVSSSSLSREKLSVSLGARLACQLKAASAFWRRHPFAAAGALSIGGVRTLLARLT